MKELINWCNQNEGFLSFVLSAVTIVISIIAIKTSINTAKLPFKIKLKVIPFTYLGPEGIVVDLVIYNQGYSKTGIECIAIMDNKKLVIGSYTGETLYLEPGYTQKFSIQIFDETEYFEANMCDLNNKIVITVQDSFGNEYTFKNGFPVG